ncbi:unnamed protein product, partial [Rotaria sp. Silwood2]
MNGVQRSNNYDSNRSALVAVDNNCAYLSLAREFISSLHRPSAIFDTQFDWCYCIACYKTEWDDVLQAGEAFYVIPRDWVRLGIHIDHVVEQIHGIWDS